MMGSEGKYDLLKKIFMPVGIIVGLIILIALFFYVFAIPFEIYVIYKVFNYVVSKVVSISGINQWLVKGIVIIALIPLIWVIPRIYWGKKKYKKIARGIALLYIATFFLILYFVSKDLYFTHSGKEPLKWYALTPEGVRYYDSPGVDTIYGIPLKPVTPEVIRNLRLWENKNINLVDPSKAIFFNPITGEPQVWYYHYPDGSFEFYDKPGYHPITGEPLKPITKQVYFEWKEKTKQKEESVKEESKRPKEQQAMIKRPELTEKERRLNEFKSLINQSITISSDKPNVAFVIDSLRTEAGLSPDSVLINFLKRNKINIIEHYFKDAFKAKGYFREIFEGNTEILKQSDALFKIDRIIIGKIDYTFKKAVQIDRDLISCNINLSYKVINRNGDIVKSDSINVVGPGFSEDEALQRGLEMLAERYSERIIKLAL